MDTQVDCRRKLLLDYFGESFPVDQCKGTCDNCQRTGTVEEKDFTELGIVILEAVSGIGRKDSLTAKKLEKIFSGSKAKDVSAYSSLVKSVREPLPSGDTVLRLLNMMCLKGYLFEDNKGILWFCSNLFFKDCELMLQRCSSSEWILL